MVFIQLALVLMAFSVGLAFNYAALDEKEKQSPSSFSSVIWGLALLIVVMLFIVLSIWVK